MKTGYKGLISGAVPSLKNKQESEESGPCKIQKGAWEQIASPGDPVWTGDPSPSVTPFYLPNVHLLGLLGGIKPDRSGLQGAYSPQ